MNYYKVEKKRNGQNWKPFNEIYASSFEEAKKQFAKDMTQDNWNKSNNIIWLNTGHGVKVSGWYDLNSGKAVYDEETENWEATDDCLLVSEEQINEGFDFWSEDVYSWRVLDIEKLYRLMNHDSSHEMPRYEVYTLDELNKQFETDYTSIDEAIDAEPEYLYREEEIKEHLRD
jgi:hypothetical protein